MMSGIQQA